jgi:pSer/pThr/pTyr-binding forkhead associated (FHA) protein
VDSQKTSFVARNMVKDVMRGLSGGEERYLRVMNGPREGERLEISDAREFIIGRDDSADVIFRDDLISRQHVKVRRDWSGTHVEDLGSRNGIKVNRKRVSRKTLRDGDELEVGGVRFVYLCPSEAPEEQAEPPPPEVDPDADDGGEHTNALPLPREARPSPKRSPTSIEKQAEAPKPAAAEAGAAEPGAELPPLQDPPAPEPVVEAAPPPPPPVRQNRPPVEEPPAERDVRRYIPVVVLGIIGVAALGVLIALFAV